MAHASLSNAKAITWSDGEWHDGRTPLWHSMSHGVWLSSFVFDGARYFEGVTPDLDLHCQRTIDSAIALGLGPMKRMEEILEIAQDGIREIDSEHALYIRPMFWADAGFVAPDPASTQFALTIHELPMPGHGGFSACLSTRRRPMPDAAPTDAKAACLYPNAGRALLEARARGFDNCVMMDPMGNIAEFATANIFHVKNGTIFTPQPNGCFLSGITRRRVMKLLRADGFDVVETRVTPGDLDMADEIFNTGNYGKVMPVTKYESRDLQPGPVFKRAKELYWDFAHG